MRSPSPIASAVNTGIKAITRVICRIDDTQLARVPTQGPLILATNHVNFLEVPIVYTHLQPRPITGFAKAETWENRFMGWLFDLWEAIPLKRGEADLVAMRLGLQALQEGRILAVAPEGTRSGDGLLQEGQAGIVLIALKSAAPILPIAVFGGEIFWQKIKKLRRTDFLIRVGNPFFLSTPYRSLTRSERRIMVDEIMYQLAALLPPAYRGVYSDLNQATTDYLHFPAGSRSNLLLAAKVGSG